MIFKAHFRLAVRNISDQHKIMRINSCTFLRQLPSTCILVCLQKCLCGLYSINMDLISDSESQTQEGDIGINGQAYKPVDTVHAIISFQKSYDGTFFNHNFSEKEIQLKTYFLLTVICSCDIIPGLSPFQHVLFVCCSSSGVFRAHILDCQPRKCAKL